MAKFRCLNRKNPNNKEADICVHFAKTVFIEPDARFSDSCDRILGLGFRITNVTVE